MEAGHKNMRKFCRDNDMDQSHICRMERGKRTPRLPYLERYAEALNVPVGIVFYLAIDEKDIKDPEKLQAFRALKPALDKLVTDMFLTRV